MTRHHVILVPGFFGFGNLGKLTYFVGVREALQRALQALSVDAEVIEVPTLPTASIRHRAARVVETLAQVAQGSSGPIHLVGHSTGGLDARLAVAPTASVPTTVEFEDYARLRTLVTVSAPHFGTPLAEAFGSAAGIQLLRLAAMLTQTAITRAHLPLGMMLRLGGLITRIDDRLGFQDTVADSFFRDIIADFSPTRRAELSTFIEGVSSDTSLIFQLTPAGCDLLNASTADPKTLRYGSVVTRARAPHISNLLAFKHNPYAHSMHALYTLLYRLAKAGPRDQFPEPVPQQRQQLETAFGEYPQASWSDGIVPTLSQVWGEVIHATAADHLDVVGHYGALRPGEATSDWLPSRSGFDDQAFEALWGDVARFIARDAHQSGEQYPHNVGTERTQIELQAFRDKIHSSQKRRR